MENTLLSSEDQIVKRLSCVNTRHPLYCKQESMWLMCRTFYEGESSVKRRGTLYLPYLHSLDDAAGASTYSSYLRRASLFNATARTVDGLVGMLFSKEVQYTYSDKQLASIIPKFFSFFTGIKSFLNKVATEVLITGRVGLLVDCDSVGIPKISIYTTESIINWGTRVVDGELKLSLLVLEEHYYDFKSSESFEQVEKVRWRVLELNSENEYMHTVYECAEAYSSKLTFDQVVKDVPRDVFGTKCPITKNDKPLNFIPFYFINKIDNTSNPISSPIETLVSLNAAHYRNSADLEHALHYTSVPMLFGSGIDNSINTDITNSGNLSDDKSKNFKIGADKMFCTSNPSANLKFLEYKGEGLTPLMTAIKNKEDQMVVIGGRLLETPKNIVESADNQLTKRFGENSIVANIGDNISNAVSSAINCALDWYGEKGTVSLFIDKDFSTRVPDAAFLNMLSKLYSSDIICYETIFDNLSKHGVIPRGRTVDDEVAAIISSNDEVF